MDFIRSFFLVNRDLIYFAYGLVFFVLGLAIALQSRSYSRLDLARSLKWLAAFGFTHGLNEWGDLFIPIQATYLSPGAVEVLHVVHLFILALSFTFLFEFGIALLRPLRRARWLHGVSWGLLGLWIFLVYFPLHAAVMDNEGWHNLSNALARYFICFPGGLLAACGLRQHTLLRIQPLNVPHIVKMLRFAGLMLAFYAVLGGLLPPAIIYFPGNLLNSQSFEAALGIPPLVFRSLVGLGLVLAVIRALEVFNVETDRMIEAIEQEQILAAERDRLARDLHDGTIQKVYTAGLLVESAHKLAGAQDARLASRLEKAEAVLNDAIGDLRHSLDKLENRPSIPSLPQALQELAEDPRYRTLVDISLDLDLPTRDFLSPVRSDHVLAIVQEALANVVRHSRARQVKLSAHNAQGKLILIILDDGVGLPPDVTPGYGLRNMRDRARLLGGNLEVKPANGKGTRVMLEIPWKDER